MKYLMLLLLLTGCSENQLLCEKPNTKELEELQELNATLGALVIGMKKNVCFKRVEAGKVDYFKVVFNNKACKVTKSKFIYIGEL